MIITERKNDADEFLHAPIYFLTGDLETAKFYSNLASATAKFGTYLEKQIKESVSIPIIEYSEINTATKKSLLAKQNIDGVIPDFIIVEPETKTIHVCEVKSNMFNMDSKQCQTENNTGLKMLNYFNINFLDFTTKIYLVNFFGFQPSKRGKHIIPLTNNFNHINGKDFAKIIDIDYQSLLNKLKNNRDINKNFIESYKSKTIEVTNL
jgi:hypothetical protein